MHRIIAKIESEDLFPMVFSGFWMRTRSRTESIPHETECLELFTQVKASALASAVRVRGGLHRRQLADSSLEPVVAKLFRPFTSHSWPFGVPNHAISAPRACFCPLKLAVEGLL